MDDPFVDLVVRAQSGDSRARADVTKKARHIVRSELRRIDNWVRPVDRDDLEQEGMLAVLSAIDHFDLERGTAFGAYVRLCIRSRMSTWRFANTAVVHLGNSRVTRKLFYRLRRSEVDDDGVVEGLRRALAPALQIDGELAWMMPSVPSAEEEILDRQEIECQRERVQEVMARLSPRDQEIFRRRLAGHTLAAIAHDVGVAGERIRQIQQRVVERVIDGLQSLRRRAGSSMTGRANTKKAA